MPCLRSSSLSSCRPLSRLHATHQSAAASRIKAVRTQRKEHRTAGGAMEIMAIHARTRRIMRHIEGGIVGAIAVENARRLTKRKAPSHSSHHLHATSRGQASLNLSTQEGVRLAVGRFSHTCIRRDESRDRAAVFG